MYTAAVIGCGRAGFLYDLDKKRKEIFTHIGGYRSNKKISKIIAVDKNKGSLKKIKEVYPDIQVFESAKDLFSEEKVDILSVATPTGPRLDIIMLAIQNGVKAIFCEKPIAEDTEEANKILSICKNHDVILAVNHFRRWDNLHIVMSNMIKSKKIGDVQNIVVKYNKGILNTGSHIFDLISMVFGKIYQVRCIGVAKNCKKDPTLHVHGKTDSGIDFFLIGSDHEHFRMFEFEILGTSGRIVNDNGYLCKMQGIEDSINNSEFKVLSDPDSSKIVGGRSGHYENAVSDIIFCIENNESQISCSGIDGVRSLLASLSSINSYRNESSVELLDSFLV